jgi:hypothetical protein
VIDGMSLAEAGEIFAYWADSPPAHLMAQAIARMLGWKSPEKTPPLADLLAMPPPGLAIVSGGALGMPAPVLDIDELRACNRARLAKTGRTI